MSKISILTDFSNYRDDEIDQPVDAITTSMKDNPHFPNPDPTIEKVEDKNKEYRDDHAAAQSGGKALVAKKNKSKKELVTLLKKLGRYVRYSADGDEEVLRSSGFPLTETRRRTIGPLPKPQYLEVNVAGKGKVQLNTGPIKGTRIYRFEHKKVSIATGITEESASWQIVESTKSQTTLTGLESGQEYFFRVVPIGTDPSRTYSDEVRSFVL